MVAAVAFGVGPGSAVVVAGADLLQFPLLFLAAVAAAVVFVLIAASRVAVAATNVLQFETINMSST